MECKDLKRVPAEKLESPPRHRFLQQLPAEGYCKCNGKKVKQPQRAHGRSSSPLLANAHSRGAVAEHIQPNCDAEDRKNTKWMPWQPRPVRVIGFMSTKQAYDK